MFTTMSAQLSTSTLLWLIEYLRTRSDAQNELPAGAEPVRAPLRPRRARLRWGLGFAGTA